MVSLLPQIASSVFFPGSSLLFWGLQLWLVSPSPSYYITFLGLWQGLGIFSNFRFPLLLLARIAKFTSWKFPFFLTKKKDYVFWPKSADLFLSQISANFASDPVFLAQIDWSIFILKSLLILCLNRFSCLFSVFLTDFYGVLFWTVSIRILSYTFLC